MTLNVRRLPTVSKSICIVICFVIWMLNELEKGNERRFIQISNELIEW